MNRLNGLKRLTMIAAAAAMMMAALPAQADDYVFTYDGGYLAVDGANIVYTPTLTAQCVWHCVSNTGTLASASLGGTSRFLYATDAGGTRRWLVGGTGDGRNLTTNNSAPGTAYWRLTNNCLNYRSGNDYYVYYRSGSWKTSRRYNGDYYGDGSYREGNNSGTDYRAAVITSANGSTSPYDVTVVSVPTISPASATLESGDDEEFTASATATKTTYTPPAHTTFTISAVTYYYYNNTIYTSRDAFSNRSETHPAVSYAWTKSGDGNTNLTLSSTNTATTTATHSSAVSADKTVTLTVTASATGAESQTATATVYLLAATPEAPAIVRSGLSQAEISCPSMGVDIYYTVDGSTPTNGSTPYSGPFDLTTSPTTVKAVAIRNGHSSSTTTETLKIKLPTPAITLVDADATIAAGDGTPAGTKLYYTTDGTTPTDASTEYTSGTVVLVNPQILTVVAILDGYDDSDPAKVDYVETGINGSTVILDDREDHTWTYYAGIDASVDGGNYNTTYDGKIYSPNPRNVKITYRGGSVTNASAVAISALDGEGQNEMIYYKTLEKSVPNMTGDYPYTVISNPFSKRPRTNGSNGNNGYWGFAGWKVISGGEYIAEYADNATLPLDATIHFTGLDAGYTPNCISAEIVFEATWTGATVKTGTSAPSFTGGTYETNFWVLTGNANSAVSVPANSTMSARYPDGTVSTNSNFTRAITAGGDNAKVEFVNMNSTADVSAAGYTFTMGRGIVNSGNGGTLSGATSAPSASFNFKVESGKYTQARLFNSTGAVNAAITVNATYGCDYDRASNNPDSKLTINGQVNVGYGSRCTSSSTKITVRALSGTFASSTTASDQEFYMGFANVGGQSPCTRYLEVLGGTFRGGIAGGVEANAAGIAATTDVVTMRIKGGTVHQYVYGAGQYSPAYGTRTTIITGGTFNCWVAVGAYGTSDTQGNTNGNTRLYFGGKAQQTSTGGVFGGGYGSTTYNGADKYTVNQSVVVMADEAEVAGNVYGGGNNGYAKSDIDVYVTGGTVLGNVFGGANMAPSQGAVAVTVTKGKVTGGVFGGSNQSGAISGQITVDVYGTDPHPNSGYAIGEVYGGGNVAAYTGNPLVTVHCSDKDISVGELYGGGKGSTATITGNTNVTVRGGNRIGYVYGGGNQAPVSGNTSVTVNGGTMDYVFGGNNNSGAIGGTITVEIEKQASTCPWYVGYVYGGGNMAAYSKSGQNYPVVNVKAGLVSHNVYGGGKGNPAVVTGNPQVTLSGTAQVGGNVYGGGDAARVDGNTKVTLRD